MLDELQAADIEELFPDASARLDALRAVIARAEALVGELEQSDDENGRRELRHTLFGLLATYGGQPLVEDRPRDAAVLRARIGAFRAAWEERLHARLDRGAP